MRFRFLLLLAAAVLTAGCSNGDKKAAELLDTATFEEKQHNLEHATKLYDEILKNYPASQAAREASNRISALKKSKP